MHTPDLLGVGALVALIAFQAWLTHRIWTTDAYDREQKRAQSKLIWLVPIAGPLVVYLMLRHVGAEQRSPRP